MEQELFPWTKNSFVEQDIVICRALVDVFSDPFLSDALEFRGGEIPSAKQFLANMDEKMTLNDYLGDAEPLLRSGVTFNPHEAYAEFKKTVLPLI